MSLEKLTNQLEDSELVLAALVAVSLTDTGLWPVCSATSAESMAGSIGMIEYWPLIIWPIFFGRFVTLYEIHWELRSIWQLPK